MSEKKSPATKPEPSRGPLIPSPIVAVIAVAITAMLLWHIWYDASHAPYDGGKTTILLGAIVLFTLGFDIGKWFRGGGS